MKKLFLIMAFCFVSKICFATLTAGYTPCVLTGGSNPAVQNCSIYDTGSSGGAGNVGIGSLIPQDTLTVYGSLAVRNSLNLNSDFSSTGNGVIMAGANLYARPASGSSLYNDTGTTYLTGGNLGVGLASAAEVLDVHGEVKTLGIMESGIPVLTTSGGGFTYACWNSSGVLISKTGGCT